jgi:hypothetical protein
VDVILQLAAHRPEAIANGDVDILVRREEIIALVRMGLVPAVSAARGLMSDDQFPTGNAEFDPNVEGLSVGTVVMGGLDDHATTRNPIVILIEFIGFLLDPVDNRVGMVNVVEARLHGNDHTLVLQFIVHREGWTPFPDGMIVRRPSGGLPVFAEV